jgi:hypothetical protein
MNVLAYARLMRLPNVFTALADVGVGVFASGLYAADPLAALLLAVASASLYTAGMVSNDCFDLAEDQRERPFRPLPAGQISLRTAQLLTVGLMLVGVAAAMASGATGLASTTDGSTTGTDVDADAAHAAFRPLPGLLAVALVVAILLYNGWLKRTPLGPVSMASCRVLNVLLAFSLAEPSLGWATRAHVAAVVGVYIIGVTWFARAEAGVSDRDQLRLAVGVVGVALLLAVLVPVHLPAGTASAWPPYLLVGFALVLAGPIRQALANPQPARVQAAVKRMILGLIGLDAILLTTFTGPSGLLLLLLLPPALILGKRIYST